MVPSNRPAAPEIAAEVAELAAFVTVARTRTVGRAARLLGRTQPSISARLASLERSWNTRLFRRVARGMELTPEGARLLPLAESSLRSLEELDRVAGLPVATSTELRIGSGDALGRELLPRSLSKLLRAHRDLDVYLREGPGATLLDALRDGEIDLAFVVWNPDAALDGLDVQPWIESDVELLVPRGAPGRRVTSVESIASERLVTLHAGSGFRRHLERAFAAAGCAFRSAVEVGNLSLVRRFVAAGLGVAPVPAIAFRGRSGAGTERRRLDGVPPVRYARAIRAGAPLSDPTRELLRRLRAFACLGVLVCTFGLLTGLGLSPAAVAAPSGGNLELASVHAVVGGLAGGEVLFAKRENIPVPIASVAKLMTAMVVLDGGQPLDEWISILPWSESHGKNAYSRLRIGSQATRGELLRIALMSSENLAAHTLARHYPGGLDAFVEAMNAKANALGMSDSRFDDPTGLSTLNRSTASDLFKMARAAYGYDVVREFSTTYQHTVSFRKPRTTLGYGNTNPLTASSRWNVSMSKTGYLTEAGRCLVIVTEIDSRLVVIVLLNSFGTRTPLGDAGRVRRWLQTGTGGGVAGPARGYERRIAATFDEP